MRFVPFACLLALGCSKEEPVRVYDAPKPVEIQYRILGGCFPADDPQWFVKVSGRTDEMDKHAADVDKLLASMRFINGPTNLPVWELPAGWKNGGPAPAKMAAETFLFGPEDKPILMTLSQAKGGLHPNLARWAGQLGLTYQEADVGKYTKPLGTGLRVEMTGPNNPSMRGPRM